MGKLLSIVVAVVWLLSGSTYAQEPQALDTITPPPHFDNIYVKPLYSDSLSSSFLIWVKERVSPHYHAFHSEHVYVLEGQAIMQIGETEIIVSKGDVIFIPAKTIHAVKVSIGQTIKVLSVQSPGFYGKDRILVD